MIVLNCIQVIPSFENRFADTKRFFLLTGRTRVRQNLLYHLPSKNGRRKLNDLSDG